MAITMMCNADTPGARVWQAGQFKHHYDCPHYNQPNAPQEATDECPQYEFGGILAKCRYSSPIYVHTIYQGCVLTTRERNSYHDSDFYAVVWDEEEQRVREVEYATTRAWTYPNKASADATDEVKEKARKWLVQWALQQWDDENKIQAKKVLPGKRVRVVKGRKVPIGTEGWIGSIEESRYGWGSGSKEVACMDTVDGERYYYVAVGNLEVVEPEQYLKTKAERKSFARAVERSNAWHVPFTAPGFVVI